MDKKKQRREQMDDAITNATKLAEIQELQRELAEIKVEHEDLRNQLKRAVADYQNLEKRITEGRSELTSFVAGELVRKLLDVLDHLETVLEKGGPVLSDPARAGESKEWFKGVELAVKQFRDVLRLEGLEAIQDVGEFDPSLHEAVDTRVGDDNMIIEVARRGYTLNGKVLRPAQVVVGRKVN